MTDPIRVGYVCDIPDRVEHKKGVSRYVESLREALRDRGDVVVIEMGPRGFGHTNIDILHVTAPRARYLARLPITIPTVLVVHGLDLYWPDEFQASLREPKAWLNQKIVPALTWTIDHFIAVSRFLEIEVSGGRGILGDRISHVHHGVDSIFRERSADRGQYILTDTPTEHVGQVYREIWDAGFTHDLVIVGERGYGHPALDVLDGHPRVRIRGHVDDATLAGLYAGADVFLHHSPYEGFGMTCAEAMAAGTPVVCNGDGSLSEVVNGGGIVTSKDRFGQEIGELLRHDDYRRRVAEAGWEWSKQYTWEQAAKETVDVYREVLDD